MQRVGYIPNTFEENMIHMLVDRREMEKEAILSLTAREVEVIRMKYYDSMTSAEIAESLGLSHTWVNKVEQEALMKLRHVILKHRTDVVDSTTGMKENDWEYLAGSIARWLEYQSTNGAFLRRRHGLLTQWAKNIIVWNLTPDERQILLWYHQIMPYPGKLNQEYYDSVKAIHERILELLLEDDLMVQKTNYKERAR